MNTSKFLMFLCCIIASTFLVSADQNIVIKNKNFFERVSERQKELRSHLCLGMDPREEWFQNSKKEFNKKTIVAWGKQLIDQTESNICCIKPNLAFYAQVGLDGLEALKEIIGYAKERDIPVLLDAKYGDIGSTAAAYARAAFEYFDADCVTLNPYLGYDAIKPFLEYENRSVFILAKTSNPSSQDIQDVMTTDGRIYECIAQKAREWGDRVGIVVGATMSEQAKRIREINEESWILAPGIGAQGGDIEKIVSAIGKNVIFPIARGISNNKDLNPSDAALYYKNEIEKNFKNQVEDIATDLMDHNIIKFGQFTLKSGSISPIYIDLRSIISHPELLDKIVNEYVNIIREKNIEFDQVAGVAYGALGIAFRVATILKKPMLLVKKEDEKQYGIANKALIGDCNKGEKILLIEDIATTGGSTLRAAEKLTEQGLRITDAVVFLDRESTAKDNLAEKNITMHAAMTISDMLNILKTVGKISDETHYFVQNFIHGEESDKEEIDISLETEMCGCTLRNPFILASGARKTSTDLLLEAVDGGSGAVTTKSVNTYEREGHKKPVFFDWELGLINAIGLPGKGAQKAAEVIKEYKRETDVPIIASIFGHNRSEFVHACEQILEGDPDIIEVNMSCPNVTQEFGLPFACDAKSARKIIEAVRSVCDKPIFAKLAPNVPDIAFIAKVCLEAGADGITVINTMPGMIIDVKSGKHVLSNKSGGLSGRAIKPIAVKAIYDIRRAFPDVPIIGTGGVINGTDAIEMLMAGATAIGITSAIYYRGIGVFEKLAGEVKQFMQENNYDSLDKIRNMAHLDFDNKEEKKIMERKVFNALKWIVRILEKHGIEYTISGGLGARFYGSERPLNDIDIDISGDAFDIILDDVRKHIVWGHSKYKNPRCDLQLLRLNFDGVEIDLGGANDTKLYDAKQQKWVTSTVDFSKRREFSVNGLKVYVMDPYELIAYKKILSRDCDLADVEAMKKFLK